MALSTSPDSKVPTAARARALAGLSGLGSHDRTSTDTTEHGRAALALYAGLEDPAGLAHAQWLVGLVMTSDGEPSSGTPLVTDALASFRRLGDRWGVAAALSIRGWEQLRCGELPGARRDGEESWSLFVEVGDRWGR